MLSEQFQGLRCNHNIHTVQGDGTASIFSGRSDVFTLSVHAANNFPSRKQLSTLDVPLPDGTDDAQYMAMLANVLPDVLSSFKPQLVLYDAGE